MKEYCEIACMDHRRRTRHTALKEDMRKPKPRNPIDTYADSEDDDKEGGEEEPLPGLASQFFSLSAMDINMNEISFSDFRGKVTVITNVASECGYTESHYEGMVELYGEFAETGLFNIVAFPSNQFGEQEPGTNMDIKKFAEEAGATFTIMDKVNVNGPQAHPVYKFLQREVGPPEIEWNFATYYVIAPDGSIRSFSNVEPEDLKDVLIELLDDGKDEL